jgi:hypothetical protein
MDKNHPVGSVQGLCTAGATCFALAVAFLGAWGFQGAGTWRPAHVLVIIPLLVGTLGFGLTPFFATRPVENPEGAARNLYLASVLLATLAIAAAVYESFVAG